ncbi:MAG: pseudouridine synthase [Bacteroidales bacterium]
MSQLSILYSDDYFTAINKPCGMLVHRTSIAEDDNPVVLQLLRAQLNRMVYPVHRIDRPTSGVLIFAHSPEMTSLLQQELQKPIAHKRYTALVRGWVTEEIICNREVKNDRGNLQTAETRFVPIKQFELPFATDRYSTARYSIVEAYPTTGRWHQIRQHLAQLRHYIINDRLHGDGKQNRLFAEHFGIHEMFLHATSFQITHPVTGEDINIEAPFPEHWSVF